MAVIRSFKASDVFACFEEAAGGGATFDINAPRNAPAKTPASYLSSLIWHSSLFQYEVAAGPTDVVVNHAALATKDTHVVVSTGGLAIGAFPPTGSSIGFIIQGDHRVTDLLLYTHGLGYVPKFMVALDGRRVPDGFIVQVDGSGGHRRVSVFATSTGIYLRESAISTSIDLASVSKTYRVMVFRTRSPNPALAMFSGSAGAMQLARGIIDTTRKYLRRTGSGDTPFALNMGRTLDIKNGGARSASGGVVVSEPRYNGSMTAPSYISAGVD
jgi:hypothetical protein